MAKMILLIVLMTMLFGIYVYMQVSFPRLQKVKVTSDKLLTGNCIKIMQISDYHDSRLKNLKKRIYQMIETLHPDIILITGDFIDQRTKDYINAYDFIEQVVKRNPYVYFVSGNHEWKNKHAKTFLRGLDDRKVRVLNNKNELIHIKGIKINICGIDDFYTGHSDVSKAFSGINDRLLTLLLSHSPDVVTKEKNIPADLILSGHTHGGQIRVPLIGALIAPGQGLFPKYNKGLYKVNSHTILYIDSGLGTSRVPIRLFNRSQVSLITIMKE